MALENCPECKKEISSQAKSCPHCGYMPKKRNGCLDSFLVVLGAIIICFIMVKACSPKEETLEFIPTEYDALIYAQKKITEQLKSPSTAKFPNYTERKDHSSGFGNEFQINSWVDSQNSFGAMIRTYYSCKVVYEGDYVRIEDLKIE